MVVMLSLEMGLRRLRSYESACRRQAETALDDTTKRELTKLAESFCRAVEERQAAIAQDSESK